jgi:GNAT superfamily N-acetyltransferase
MVRTWVHIGGEVERTSYGSIIRDQRHPLVHEANLAWVERAPEGGVPRALEDLDRAFAATAVRHRNLLFADPQVAYEHQDAFVARGFHPVAELGMARLGLPSCIVNPDLEIREVGIDAPQIHYDLVQTTLHAESGYGREESRQLLEVEAERRRAVGDRVFVAYLGEEPAGAYGVWPRGRFAILGAVGTLPAFRMRGVGRTMIFDACQRSLGARCEYVLLTTNLFDTPQAMYKTLGFEPIGELRGFLRRTP